MNRIIAFVLLLSVVGCSSGPDVPNGILPPRKMQHVMWDMIRADGLVSYSYDTMMRKPGKREELYSIVLRTHKLTQEEFRKNMQYYQTRPDLLKLVLDSLQQMALRDTVTIKQDTTQNLPDTVKVSQDTIKVSQDTIKASLDTVKTRLDTIKARKLSAIERIKVMGKGKPQ